MYLCYHSALTYKGPADYIIEADNDWTHFPYLHRKSHLVFQLLAKTTEYSIFLYRTKLLSWLPYTLDFIVFREMVPEREGYRQVYIPIKGGKPNVLESYHERHPQEGTVTSNAEFYLSVKWYWRPFPKLFCFLLGRRMMKVWTEDFNLIKERMRTGLETKPACAPQEYVTYRFDTDFLAKNYPVPEKTYFKKIFEDLYDEKNSFKVKLRPQVQDS